MRTQRGPRGQFSSLYGTTALRLKPEFPYPPGGPRYERLVFDANDQLIVPLNEWYHLMKGTGAARTRETYLAVLRPWFGFLTKHGYQWNTRPEAVREYTRLFLLEAGCALRAGRVEGWFVQATNRSPISANGLHLLIAALRSFYTIMLRGVFDPQDQRYHPLYAFHNPKIGIDVAAFVRNKGDHTLAKPIWCSADTRAQLHRYLAHDRSRLDLHRRTRLEQLGDDDPIFLSRHKRQLEYSGFRIVFKRLLTHAQHHFAAAPQRPDAMQMALPSITPHTIRHLHTTFRVKKVRELFSSPAERERALEALVDDLGWRSAEMLKTYDHAITRSELRELMVSSVRQMLADAPHDAASLEALLRCGAQFGQTHASDGGQPAELILSDEA